MIGATRDPRFGAVVLAGVTITLERLDVLSITAPVDAAGVARFAAAHGNPQARIRRLKEMGSNAYRCAHNPPAPEGMIRQTRTRSLLLQESLWDGTIRPRVSVRRPSP